jgi:hypothetical protein
MLIPTANNLSPFGKKRYFDGQQKLENTIKRST